MVALREPHRSPYDGAGVGTVGAYPGCRAVIGPGPYRHSRWLFRHSFMIPDRTAHYKQHQVLRALLPHLTRFRQHFEHVKRFTVAVIKPLRVLQVAELWVRVAIADVCGCATDRELSTAMDGTDVAGDRRFADAQFFGKLPLHTALQGVIAEFQEPNLDRRLSQERHVPPPGVVEPSSTRTALGVLWCDWTRPPGAFAAHSSTLIIQGLTLQTERPCVPRPPHSRTRPASWPMARRLRKVDILACRCMAPRARGCFTPSSSRMGADDHLALCLRQTVNGRK